MFIDCHCFYCPSSVRSNIRAPDIAPHGAGEHNPPQTINIALLRSGESLCRNLSSCLHAASAFL